MKHLYFTAILKNVFKSRILPVLLFLTGMGSYAQNCTVNAGVLNVTLCETEILTLAGNNPSPIIGTVEWSQVSGPAVVITSPNSPTTTVTGYTGGNTYTFRYAATCGDGIYAYQDKVVNVLPITIANAGGSIASCPDSSGGLVITGNTPLNPGETGHWEIVGGNNAGVVINFPNSATSTISLPTTSCGATNVQWVIEGTEYAPGQRCRTTSQITITNYGGVTPVSAGPDQTLSNCYTTTQSTTLQGSYGGCGLNGQNGTWQFVSGPNTPTISSPNSNSTNISNLVQGTYVFRWTVTGPCASGNDLVVVNVPAATQDVTTLPGGTETIVFCDNTITQVTLEGVTPLYAGETVQWTQTGGGSAVIVSPNNPTTLVTGISDSGDPYTFRYTLTNSVTGCVSTKDYVVQYTAPTRTIEANNGDNLYGGCDQNSFNIAITTTGSGSNSYRIVDGPDASPLGPFPTAYQSVGSNLNISLTAPGIYIIEFVRTADGDLPAGCDYGFDSINVIVSNEPTPANAGSDQNLACGVTSTALAGVTTSDEGNNFWSQLSGPNNAVIANPNQENTTVSGLIAGSYIFQYITKGGGVTCGFSTSNVTINVSDTNLSTPDAGPNQLVCTESQVQLAAVPPQPGELGTWSQVSGPDTITFSNSNDPNAIATGFNTTTALYELQWTIGYLNPGPSCGSPVSDTVEIATNNSSGSTPADAGADTCYPSGTTVINLTANATGLLEQGTWTVTPSAGVTFADANDENTTATVPGDGTYTFTWTIAPTFSGCEPSSDDVTITVATTPVAANAGPDQSACSDTFVMAATASSGGVGTWTRVSGFANYTVSDVNDPNATFTFASSGFYIFRWTVDADICGLAFDDVSIAVGIPPSPANAGPDQKVCGGTSAILAANDYDDFFETGQWSVLSGAPNVPVFADPTNPNTTISGLTTGSYTLRWTISAKNVFMCPDVFDDVVINVAPPANAGPDASYCDVTSVQLVAATNSKGTWSLTSTTGDPLDVVITQSPSDSYIANATVVPGQSYVFTFTTSVYTFPDLTTCAGTSDAVNVQIFSGPSIDPNAGPDQTLCISDVSGTATLDGNTAPGDVTDSHWEFVYQPSGSGAVITTATNPDTTVTNLTTPGLYILAWVFESNSCRTVSDIVRIVMYQAPSVADAGPDDTVACQQTYQTNAVPPAVGIGTWSFANPGDDPSGGDVVIDNPNNPVTTLSNITTLGTYVLTWTVTNGPFTSPSLCDPSVDTVVITFNDDPPSIADAGPDQELCNATQATMDATPVTSGIGTWTQTSGPNTANIASPNSPASVMFGLVPGTYEFTWTTTTINDDGCTSVDAMEVEVYALPSAADAGPNQQLPQFDPVVMAANTPTIGTGSWTQVSGPSTVAFTNVNSPTTNVTGTISGTYVLQWNIDNGNCASATDQVTIQIVALADLELSKSVSPTSGSAGDVVTFTIQVFNNNALGGSVNATGVAVKDMIPAGYTLVPGTVSNAGVYNLGDHSITWSNISVTNGSTISLTFNATINATGSYVNTAQITASNQFDPDSTPNNSIATEDDQDDAAITIQSADLSVQKTVAPTAASIGDSVVFTVTVTNSGPDNATGVTVSDQLPAGYTYVSDNSSGAYNSTTGIWTIGTINNGATASIQVTVTVNAAGILDYQNIAEVETSNQIDPDSTPGNGLPEDDMDDASVIAQEADLELLKSVSQPNVVAGTTVTFTLTVINNGPGNATGVSVADILPDGYTIVPGTVSNGGSYQVANSTITWQNLSILSSASQDLTFNAVVNATGNHLNTAQITASDLPDPDSTPGNSVTTEDDYDEIAVTVSPFAVDLSLTKTVVNNNLTPLVGSQISFEIEVINSSANTATGVQVTDFVPSGYQYVLFSSTSGNYDPLTGIWNVGTIAPNTSEILLITVNVNTSGNYENIAEVSACDQPDTDSTPNNSVPTEDDYSSVTTVPVALAADISLLKSVNNTTPLIGSQVTFEIIVGNDGPQDATGVSVTDLLPSGYTYNSFTATVGAYVPGTGLWYIGNLGAGVIETLQITATVNPTGDYLNTAEVTTSSLSDPDSTPGNGNTAEDDYGEASTVPVPLMADLEIGKIVDNPTPVVGSQVIFSIGVTNVGPYAVNDIIVTDLLPSGYTFVSYTATDGVYLPGTGEWLIDVIQPGEIPVMAITATVNASGDYTNIAEITASSLPDPNSTPGNGDVTEDDYDSVTVVPIPQSADLSITKTVNNNAPVIGTQVTFSVQVTNSGPHDTTEVEVTDLLPSGYTYVSYTTTSGSYDNTTGLWTVGNVPNGVSHTLQIAATVNATGDYTNTVEVTTSSLPDPDSTPGNGDISEDDYASAATVPVLQSADLSITKTVNNNTPVIGTPVTFSIQVTNSGPQDASGVAVTDLLPAGYTYVSYTTTSGSYDNTTGLWTVGNVANGVSHTLQVTAIVNATGPYLNTAEIIASNQSDPDSTPNNAVITEDDYATALVLPAGATADLSLTKSVNNATPVVGSQVTFEIIISNRGPNDATGVAVEDLLPNGYIFNSYTVSTGTFDSTTGIWTVGNLANAEAETLQITATVISTGNYNNIAEIRTSDQIDPDSTPNNAVVTEDDYATATTVPVGTSADLSLTKAVNNATPLVGSQVTFSIQVTNSGSQDATGVSVTDLLPAGYTYGSYTATAGSYNSTTGLWTVGTVVIGASHTLQITATVNTTGPYVNTAEVTASSQPDPDSTPNNGVTTEDDYATATTVPVGTSADLSLSKAVNNATPLVGSQVTFSIQVTNSGPQDATGVSVTDLLPAGYTYVSYTATSGNYDSTTGLWTVGTMLTGLSHTLQITATVNATGPYVNTAEVTASSQPDPDSTPNNGVTTEDDYATAVTIPVGTSADLSLTKTVNDSTLTVGDQAVFEIIVTNNGPQATTGVVVTDLLAPTYTFGSYTVSTGTYNNTTGLWTVGNLSVGQSETLQITVTVNAVGTYSNTAEITASNQPDPDSTPNNGVTTEDDYAAAQTAVSAQTPVDINADLSVTKTVNNTTPLVGSQVIFTITVSNAGPFNATGVTVTDLLPSGYTYVSYNATDGTYNPSTGVWLVNQLPDVRSETLQIVATVNAAGNYTNIAEVTSSSQPDPDSTPNNAVITEDDYATAVTVPVPVNISADLAIVKSVDNATPLVGTQVTFSIAINNTGPFTASGVSVTDLLPSGYTFVSYTATAGVYTPSNGIWLVGTIANGDFHNLQISATVNGTGNYTNIAEVTSSTQPDPDSTPNNGVTTEDDYATAVTVPVPVNISADLAIVKSVDNATPLVGTQVTFSIGINNTGPFTASGVSVTDLLPSGYTFVSYTATAGVYTPSNGIWLVGTMANGDFHNLQISATVNGTGDYTNIAEVTSSTQPDPDSTPNNGVTTEDDYATAVTIPVGTSADLSLTKTVNNNTPLVGSQVIFSLQVTNSGPQNAAGVAVTDLLPAGYTYVSYTATAGSYNNATGLWTVGTVLTGASHTLQITATVNATGSYVNTAEITASSQPDPDSTPGNSVITEDDYATAVTIPVGTSADLSLTKTVNNATPLVGSQVTFSLQISNSGPQNAAGVTVTDLLPAGYTYASYTSTAGSYNNTTGLWTVGTVLTGASHTLQIVATVNATGPYVNTAEITASSQPDSDSTPGNSVITEDDYATAVTIPVGTSADLSLTKTVNNNTPLVGSQVTFSLQLSNAGPQNAAGVTVNDLLPAGYTYVSYTATAGSYNNTTGLWTVGTVLTGASHTLQITATVNATGPYVNTAEVTASSQPDPDSTPGNAVITEDDYATAVTIPVGTSADLSLTKTVNNATPLAGSQVTFEVVITNNGPQNTAGVQVTDLLPSGYAFNSFTVSTGTYNSTTGLWTVGNLINGESETLQITAIVNGTGDYTNVAEVTSSSQPDPDSTPNNGVTTEDDYATVITVPVAAVADISLTKTVVGGNLTPVVGTQVSFEIIISNNGPQDAGAVQVTDLLPSGYTYVIHSATAGNYNSTTGVWHIGMLFSGDSSTLIVTATVNASGNYTNSAEVTASNIPDPDSTVNNGVTTEDDYASVTTVPIPVSADLSITKTVGNPTPLVGAGIVFTVVVTNNGPQDTGGVQVMDLLPSGYSYIVATATTGIYNANTGVWQVGTIASGVSETLLINASVLPSGNYLNIAEITASSLPDPDSTPNNGVTTEDDYASISTAPIAVSADLSVTKTVNNVAPIIGSTVTFEVIVTNSGPQTATGVSITDLLPSGYSYVLASATAGIYNSTTGIWIVGSLVSGASETLLINGTVLPTGNYQNIAEITASNQPDPDSTPNNGVTIEDDYASAVTVPVPATADLSLTKTIVGGNTTPLVGTQIIFNITVENSGPQPATGVLVTDLLQTGYTFVSYTATDGIYNEGTGVWNISSAMASGASATLQITVLVNATGNYLNIAEITSSNILDPDSTPGNGVTTEDDYSSIATVPITIAADLSITKTVNNTTPVVGSTVTFEIIITNNGPQTATGIQITDMLPTGYAYVVASPTAGIYNSANGIWVVGTLASGASETLLINGTVLATGNYLNIAEITASNEFDPDSTPNNGITTEDDYASAITVPVTPLADLSLVKTIVGGNTTPLVGAQIIFNIEVSNAGPESATGVQVLELLPSGYTFVSYNATEGIYNDATGIWTMGDALIAGASSSLQITATVNPSGNYLNVAEISASNILDPDSTPGNGVATEDDYDSIVTVPVATVADISLTKTIVGGNLTPLVGSQVSFEIVVSNIGPQSASGVQVTDLLPSGYTYVIHSATAGNYNSATGVWHIGMLFNGDSSTLIITATVNPTGNYTNIAEVTASSLPDPDSTPANGSAAEDDYGSVVLVPIAMAADLSLTKTVIGGNLSPLAGSQVSFEIVVNNNGPQNVTGVKVTDLLPSGYTYVIHNASSGSYNSTTGLWNIGSLFNSDSETLIVTATVNATGNYTNIAEITASSLADPDSTPGNAVATEDDYGSVVLTPILPASDLSLTKTVNTPTALVGTQVTFEVIVTNNGPQNTAGVTVTDLLPSGYTFNSFTVSTGVYNSTTGLWNIGTLLTSESQTLIITATVNATGNYTNIAEITASNLPDPDSTPGNAVATEDDYGSATITPIQPTADLSLTKTVNTPTALVGTQVTFEVIVTNNGPQNTTGVTVTDLLPSGYFFNSFTVSTGVYNSTTGLWTVGDLANGESETLQIVATLHAVGNVINEAEVTGSSLPDPDSVPGNGNPAEDDYGNVAVIPIAPVADLSLTKSVIGGNLSPIFGATITFEITVTNNGPQDATNVKVIDLLPSGYEYIVFSSTAGNYNQQSGLWIIGTIPDDAIETLLITAVVNDTGNYLNTAEIYESERLDPNSVPNNNNDTEDDQDSVLVMPIPPQADLSITKAVVDNKLTPDVGELITFSVTVANEGPNIATGVLVRDIIPPGYNFVFYSASSGTYDETTGEWAPGIIQPGNSHNLLMHVTVNVPTGAPDEYLNIAELIASNQTDPDSTPDNGISTEDDYASIAVVPVIPTADLSLTKTVSNATPVVGSLVTFEIVVSNDGPKDAEGVVVNDLLPVGYTYSFSSTTAGTYDSATGVWNVGTVINNSVEVLIVYAIVNELGNHENIAQIMASSLPDPDSTPGNNAAAEDDQASATVVPVVESADLSLTKTVDNATPLAGEQVTFEISVSNAGPQDATEVQVGDLLPSGYVYVISSTTLGTYNPLTGIWDIGTVTIGDTETLLVTATVLVNGNHVNIAQVTASALPDPDSTPNNDDGDQSEDDEDAVGVQIPGTDIGITKDVDETEPAMGSNVAFTITASNLGTLQATNVEVTDVLPNGYQFVSASATSGSYDQNAGIWSIPSIAANSQQTLTIIVEVVDNNNYLNIASLTAIDQIDTNAANNEDSAEVKPKCLMVYNEFSPNDDGENDTFYIDCIDQYPDNVLEIFNRWGDKVYSRKGYDNSWDGTSDGPEKTLPVGTYFYILDLGDGSEKQSGWLYLKR